jgi:tetratricopeptide (TPR) repeat protein
MPSRFRLGFLALATLVLSLALAGPASAQGTLTGRVTDMSGAPIEGVNVKAENPNATPSERNVTTNDDGEYTLVGLRSGIYTLTFTKDGYITAAGQKNISTMSRNEPMNVQLEPGIVAPEGEEFDAAEIQGDLDAASALVDQGDYAGAIAAYEELSERLPDLTALRIAIAGVHRQAKDFDAAIAEYDSIIVKDPSNMVAKLDRANAMIEKGDMAAADAALTELASTPGATAEMMYRLGEIKFANSDPDGATEWYNKAAEKNPTWGKPLFGLAIIALSKTPEPDSATARANLEKVIEVDPGSQEAGQAKLILEQLP